MPILMTPALRARHADRPDDAFPDVMGVWSSDRTLLGELPKAGAGLHTLCCGCGERRWLGGQEICRRWPEWLLRPGVAWARALRCSCGAKRFRLMAETDRAAMGFATADEEPAMAFARRLAAWLPADGPRLDALARRLAAMPTPDQLRAAGL